MMKDMIYRQAAINAIENTECELLPCEWDELTNAIMQLPSAEPKKGRWIFARYFVWECSECGKNPTKGMGYTQSRSELFRYCPYCGTEMEVPE